MKVITHNRRAHYNYHLMETYEVGLVLQGWEVKAIRAGQIQISDCYAAITRGEVALVNSHITPLSTVSTHIHPDPRRSRKLLLHKHEIQRLIGKSRERGLSLVPLKIYLQNGKIKSTIALAKGKKQHDKRRSIQEREWNRQQGRLLRGSR